MKSYSTFGLLLLAASLTMGCVRLSINLPESAFEPTAEKTVVKAPEAPESPKSPAADLTSAMTDELRLGPEQKQQIQDILHRTVSKMRAARILYANEPAALNTALRHINQESEKQLRQALTTGQFQQYQASKQQLQSRMQAKATPALPPSGPQ